MKPDMSLRFAFIETRLQWGGGLTAGELALAFGLTRPTAQGLIDEYRKLHPENLYLDRSEKKQLPTAEFIPHYISKEAGHFLDYLRGREMLGYYAEQAELDELPLVDVDRLTRPQYASAHTRQLLAALRGRQSIGIIYRAKSSREQRDICPHSLIFASNRYHVRAYCHMKRQFLDFVLSRIEGITASVAPWVPMSQDEAWNQYVKLTFAVNAELPASAMQAVQMDYGLHGAENRVIGCRQALAFYVRRDLLAVDSRYGVAKWVEVLHMRIPMSLEDSHA